MNDVWGSLISLLTEMLDIYKLLLSLSEKKRDILVNNQVQELELITRQEEASIVQVGKLTVRREKIMKELAGMYGIAGKVDLSKLRQLAPPLTVGQLDKLTGELKHIAEELARLNKLNAELTEQAQNIINYSINLLAQTATGPTYAPQGQDGKSAEAHKKVMFDWKV